MPMTLDLKNKQDQFACKDSCKKIKTSSVPKALKDRFELSVDFPNFWETAFIGFIHLSSTISSLLRVTFPSVKINHNAHTYQKFTPVITFR
jgi:hypothetical protein